MFDPNDWYWIVGGTGWLLASPSAPFTGDETRMYSSASLAYVPPSDAAYGAWKVRVGPQFGISDPTNRIDTEAHLADVLSEYGITAVFE